ncbi:hypothetical protein KM176_06735 [Pseudooceanicola sp. CBS1P-1]|uniref:SLC13 family permease n=1 Tax=Pseudooceanicola albus TaxID=2692189 RepID=A0A6L7FZZ4_9RHOB|nr:MULTISPECIES: hypothetical protein [Pseudooceanicola]MBT9383546.1 hypothetical protein [Pseudooceanicola endophyticus]MXN17401.1 hypothetical protein [Pseudooceanicola albus]
MTQHPDPRTASSRPVPDAGPPGRARIVMGSCLGLIVALNLLHGLGLNGPVVWAANLLTIAVLAMLAPQVRGSRHVFMAISVLITGVAWLLLDDPGPALAAGLAQGSFIVAFFCALASLQHVAGRSPAIARAAAFLASQPPGRRYLALGFGAQVFALMLNYGALSLLGTMARRSAEREADPAVRALRTRRMLQGAQCGFSASLCWSPLAFATVITSALVPGAELGNVVLHGLGSALILVIIGWLVDRRLKYSLPSGTVIAPPDQSSARDVRSLWPLLWLLLGVAVPAGLMDVFAGVPPSRSVLGLVPLIAAIWVLVEAPRGRRIRELGARGHHYLFRDLPNFKGELTLLSTAGFIGSVAGALLAQWIATAGFDLSAVPARLLLVLPLLLVPLAGQLGLNPILFVSMFAQLLPAPAALGITPISMVLALTGGWALTAPTSPFTASVMIISRLGGVSPREVALRWNGVFVALAALGLAIWVQILA